MKGKPLLIILGLAVLVVLIVVIAGSGGAPTQPEPADTTSAIQEELEGIDISDIESEFDAIDADLNTL